MDTIKELSDKIVCLVNHTEKLVKYDARAEKVAALATAQEKAFKGKTREKIEILIHGQQCKFAFLWINGAFCVNASIDTIDYQKQLFTIRAKLPVFWMLNLAEKAVNQILRQARAGQSIKIRTTEKPQNPHTFAEIH